MAGNIEDKFLMVLYPYEDSTVAFHPMNANGVSPQITRPVMANADHWKNGVRRDITTVSHTQVGRILLNAVKSFGVMVNIFPKPKGQCNAGVIAGDEIRDPKPGTGNFSTGIDLTYTPDNHLVTSPCEIKHLQMGGLHIESNEVFFHELIHVFREVTGKRERKPLKNGLIFYGNNEEFYAVMLQGIYASERKKPIRASHFKHFEIDKQLNSSFNFFRTGRETYDLVSKFYSDHPQTTRALAKLDLPFNPLRAFMQDRKRAKQLSHGSLARGRDKTMPLLPKMIDFFTKL